ncbi:MAG TPA: hypothetical protein VFI37_07250 [Gaiellaceae bacterium]|nr:hypothetical protein [Gaiellaceae bacterium]
MLRKTEAIVEDAGRLIAAGARYELNAQLSEAEMDAKFGKDVVVWMKDHPADVATVASVAALVATGPVGASLALLAITASSYAAAEDLEDHKYLAVAFDIAGVATGAGGVTAHVLESSTARGVEASRTQLATLAKKLTSADANDLPSLSKDQQAAIERLVKSIGTAKQKKTAIATAKQNLDTYSALSSLIADPRSTPSRGSDG